MCFSTLEKTNESSQLKSRSHCYVRGAFLPRSWKKSKYFCAIENVQSIKTKKGLVKDSSAARKGLVRTIITYVHNACVSSVAGGKVLVMTSSQTYSVRTIMPNSQFSNVLLILKDFWNFPLEFLENLDGQTLKLHASFAWWCIFLGGNKSHLSCRRSPNC